MGKLIIILDLTVRFHWNKSLCWLQIAGLLVAPGVSEEQFLSTG